MIFCSNFFTGNKLINHGFFNTIWNSIKNFFTFLLIKSKNIKPTAKIGFNIFFVFMLFVFYSDILYSKSIYQKQWNKQELELEFDMYYSNIDYYLSLSNSNIQCSDENEEINIYKALFLSPLPNFLVFEFSVNPMPCLGVLIKKNYEDMYNRAFITENFNMIKGVCAGFEEPCAMSLFLGNVVSFKPKGSIDKDGKGYIGTLVSVGNYHIKDNELIDDNWIEGELKVKGDKISKVNKMSWSFRIGSKFHENPDIKDIIYFSLRRDRIDFEYFGLSLFKNSGFEYICDLDRDEKDIIMHYFRVGKKMPFKNSKIVFSINTGFIWEKDSKYSGILKRSSDNEGYFQFILQPNIEF